MWGGHGGGGFHGGGPGSLDDEELGQLYNHDVVKRLYPYLKTQMGMFSLAMLMMLLYTATMVLTPWLIAEILERYIFIEGGDLSGLNRAALLFLGLVPDVIGGVFTAGEHQAGS